MNPKRTKEGEDSSDIHSERPAEKRAHAEIEKILSSVERKVHRVGDDVVAGDDPRADFRRAVEIAKDQGDPKLLSSVYDRIIQFHRNGKYHYDAALIAIEAGRQAVSLSMIDMLVGPPKYDYGFDDEGAIEIGEKMGSSFVEIVKEKIQKRDDALREETLRQFTGPQTLSDVCAVTRSGSRYQVNQDGILFRDGTPFY